MGQLVITLSILLILFNACRSRTTNNLTPKEILEKGAQLYTTHGCNVCHSLDGSIVYGPPLNDLYRKKITVVRKAKEYKLQVDRKYLMRSITAPGYEKNMVYRNKEMPQTNLSNEEAELLVEYLIALDSKEVSNN